MKKFFTNEGHEAELKDHDEDDINWTSIWYVLNHLSYGSRVFHPIRKTFHPNMTFTTSLVMNLKILSTVTVVSPLTIFRIILFSIISFPKDLLYEFQEFEYLSKIISNTLI